MDKRIITLEDIEIDGEVVPKETVYEYESKTPVGYFIRTKTKNVTLLKLNQVKEFAEPDDSDDNNCSRVIKDDGGEPSRTEGSKDGSHIAQGTTCVFNGPVTLQINPQSEELKEYISTLIKEIYKSCGVSKKKLKPKKKVIKNEVVR
jgi:hypothetical protein